MTKQKTILLIDVGTAFGGSLVVIARLAVSLDPTRYRPIIVSAMDRQTIEHHVPANIKFIQLKPGFTYVDRHHATKIFSRVTFKPVFKALVYALSLYEGLKNLPFIFRLIRIVQKERVDVFHVNNSLIALALALVLRIPCVYHFHGFANPHNKRKLSFFLKNHMTALLSISSSVTQSILETGYTKEKVFTVLNPISPQCNIVDEAEKIALRKKYHINDQDIVITIFGRLVGWKGQLEFLEAFRLVWLKEKNVKAMIVGDDGENFGGYPAVLRNFVNQNELNKSVIFTGYQMDVDTHYQISDIVVHASIEPEPFGLVITEAMQNQVAVVASCYGAGPELIKNGENGLIADPKNSEELSSAILKLVQNPEERLKIAASGYRYVTENLSCDAYASKVAEIYDSISET